MSIIDSNVVEVKLTRGLVTIIDAEDFELVSQFKWYATRGSNTDYAVRTPWIPEERRYQQVSLHRFLLNAPCDMHVDHRNHQGLDNRRSNLRLCTPTENRWNTQKRKGCRSEFLGVHHRPLRKKPWMAKLIVNKKHYSRSFATELEAALYYDELVEELHGEFAKLNFPQTSSERND